MGRTILFFPHNLSIIEISYLFSTFTDTIRKPMKIGCAEMVCSHLNHVLTASSANASTYSDQLHFNHNIMTRILIFHPKTVIIIYGKGSSAKTDC